MLFFPTYVSSYRMSPWKNSDCARKAFDTCSSDFILACCINWNPFPTSNLPRCLLHQALWASAEMRSFLAHIIYFTQLQDLPYSCDAGASGIASKVQTWNIAHPLFIFIPVRSLLAIVAPSLTMFIRHSESFDRTLVARKWFDAVSDLRANSPVCF